MQEKNEMLSLENVRNYAGQLDVKHKDLQICQEDLDREILASVEWKKKYDLIQDKLKIYQQDSYDLKKELKSVRHELEYQENYKKKHEQDTRNSSRVNLGQFSPDGRDRERAAHDDLRKNYEKLTDDYKELQITNAGLSVDVSRLKADLDSQSDVIYKLESQLDRDKQDLSHLHNKNYSSTSN
jgi:chromosome segregation ATPase